MLPSPFFSLGLSAKQFQVLLVYALFLTVAVLLMLALRRSRHGQQSDSTSRKFPLYIALNLIFITAIWLPPTWHVFTILLAIVGGTASWELCRALGFGSTSSLLSGAATAALVIIADVGGPIGFSRLSLATFLVGLALLSLNGARGLLGKRILGLAAMVGYVPICLSTLLWFWQGDPGGFRTALFYLVIATNDAFAQVTGRLVGHRLLAPSISPGKTVEGALGGLFFAALLGASLSPIVGWPYIFGVCIALAVAVAGSVGDLTESAWKRALGLKDFSALLRSQGGVFDRFDGLIFAAPIFVLLLSFGP